MKHLLFLLLLLAATEYSLAQATYNNGVFKHHNATPPGITIKDIQDAIALRIAEVKVSAYPTPNGGTVYEYHLPARYGDSVSWDIKLLDDSVFVPVNVFRYTATPNGRRTENYSVHLLSLGKIAYWKDIKAAFEIHMQK